MAQPTFELMDVIQQPLLQVVNPRSFWHFIQTYSSNSWMTSGNRSWRYDWIPKQSPQHLPLVPLWCWLDNNVRAPHITFQESSSQHPWKMMENQIYLMYSVYNYYLRFGYLSTSIMYFFFFLLNLYIEFKKSEHCNPYWPTWMNEYKLSLLDGYPVIPHPLIFLLHLSLSYPISSISFYPSKLYLPSQLVLHQNCLVETM